MSALPLLQERQKRTPKCRRLRPTPLFRKGHGGMNIRRPDGTPHPQTQITHRALGPCTVLEIDALEQFMVLHQPGPDSDAAEYLIAPATRAMMQLRSGHVLTQRIPVGSVVCLDLKQAFEVLVSSGAFRGLIVPSYMLGNVSSVSRHEEVFQMPESFLNLVLSSIDTALTANPPLSATDAELLGSATVSVISRAFQVLGRRSPPALTSHASQLRERVLTLIESSHTDPDFTVSSIMQTLNLSRPTLYRLFSDDGGIPALIRDARLSTAVEIMRDRRNSESSLLAIAIAAGFTNEQQFRRATMKTRGMTPGQLRGWIETDGARK